MRVNIDRDFDIACNKDIRNRISIAFNNLVAMLLHFGFSSDRFENLIKTKGEYAKSLFCTYIDEEVSKHITSLANHSRHEE